MRFQRAVKRAIRVGNNIVIRDAWEKGECLAFRRPGPLMITNVGKPPPFKKRDVTLADILATDWH